jgi:diguanylate cyclase
VTLRTNRVHSGAAGLLAALAAILLGTAVVAGAVAVDRASPGAVALLSAVLLAATLLGVAGFLLGRRLAELRQLSLTDPLTGVGNRRYLERRLEEELARSARSLRPLSVLLVDVDKLKEINDRGGHGAGDRALCLVADALVRCTRISDVVGRYGGDEFLVIAPEADAEVGLRLARRCAGELRAVAVEISTGRLPVGLSVGVATGALPLRDLDTLLTAADRALYRAKTDGGGRAVSEHDLSCVSLEPAFARDSG